MSIAVITGASSGLGKAFFEKAVERYPELDEIWNIARNYLWTCRTPRALKHWTRY